MLESFKMYSFNYFFTGNAILDMIIGSIIIAMFSKLYTKAYKFENIINNSYDNIIDYIFSDSNSIILSSKRIITEYGSNRKKISISYLALNNYITKYMDKHQNLKNLKELDTDDMYSRTFSSKQLDNLKIYTPNQEKSFKLFIDNDKFKHLDIDCIQKKINDDSDRDSKIKVLENIIVFKSKKNSLNDISDFIDFQVEKYLNEKQISDKKKKYYFTFDSFDDDNKPYFNENDLYCDRELESIFFEGKDKLLKHYDFYEKNPKKNLNLCLYGPPGTGKTSVIQAMLNKTNRHAMCINLSKIKNGEQFERLFNNFEINGIQYKPNDFIYIMEEIDGYGDLVKDRNEKYVNDELNDKVDKIVNSLNNINNISNNKNKGDIVIGCNKKYENSKFNITNLLNVMQGINQIPGLMIFMTTNHYDYLDPALKRPGRMFSIKLDKHTEETLLQQIKYLFNLDESKIDYIKDKYDIVAKKFTGAEIEEYYSLYNNDLEMFLEKTFNLK